MCGIQTVDLYSPNGNILPLLVIKLFWDFILRECQKGGDIKNWERRTSIFEKKKKSSHYFHHFYKESETMSYNLFNFNKIVRKNLKKKVKKLTDKIFETTFSKTVTISRNMSAFATKFKYFIE